MAFHDVRLPTGVERGATGGPRFKTTLLALGSGFELRDPTWAQTRGVWDIGYSARSDILTLREVRDFFYCRRGRAHSFRFKDWADYIIGVPDTDTDQTIGTGDGSTTAFQINKRYISGNIQFSRTITKPVEGTMRVFLTSVEQFSGFSVDFATGIITFSPAPSNLVPVGVICNYDAAARFDTDQLNLSMTLEVVGTVPNITLVEVREDTTYIAAPRLMAPIENIRLHETISMTFASPQAYSVTDAITMTEFVDVNLA